MRCKTTFVKRALTHAALALGLLGGGASAQPAPTADAGPAFDAAMIAYERNHWHDAYAAFAGLADRGHAEAARIALQMWLRGPLLYRLTFSANTPQVERWWRLSACGAATQSATPSGSAAQPASTHAPDRCERPISAAGLPSR
jgi:hypothetical protein